MTEIYLVMSRREKGLPDPVKACGVCGSEIFFTLEEAERFLMQMVEEIGPHYSIFKAQIKVLEEI